MDSFPLEIYDAIFEHLHLVDVVRLRSVCRRFKNAVKEYRIRELYYTKYRGSKDEDFQNGFIFRSRNTNKILACNSKMRKRTEEDHLPEEGLVYNRHRTYFWFSVARVFLRSGLFNVQFLKSLVCYFSVKSVGAEDINNLIRLERLEIVFSNCGNLNFKLCLPSLEVLILRDISLDFHTIEIEAPKCKGFHFGDRFTFKFKNPNSVQYLSMEIYNEKAHVFRNVEHLQMFAPARSIDKHFYEAFPLLKTLRMRSCRSLARDSMESPKQILRVRNWIGRRHVRLFFSGIPLIISNELDGHVEHFQKHLLLSPFFHHNKELYPALMDNYDRLEDSLNFVTDIDLSQKILKLFERNPQRFARIFDNIIVISSEIKIDRPEFFFSFLENCKELQYLMIINSGLDQKSFDQLVNFRSLKYLIIEEKKKIDFSFTNRLPELTDLKTNFEVDLNDEVQLKQLPRSYFNNHFSILMWTGGIYLSITKYTDEYVLEKCKFRHLIHELRNPMERFNNFEDLAKRVDEIRNGGLMQSAKELVHACRLHIKHVNDYY